MKVKIQVNVILMSWEHGILHLERLLPIHKIDGYSTSLRDDRTPCATENDNQQHYKEVNYSETDNITSGNAHPTQGC